MSSIGPQLPSQLSKRKRTPEEDAAPRSKHRRSASPAKNPHEIDVEESDDDYGPAAPTASKPTVGPQIPTNNKDEIGLEDSDDDYGPAVPAPSKPSIGPAAPPSSNKDELDLDDSDSDTGPAPPAPAPAPAPQDSSSSPKRTVGPAPPPAPEDSSDSEDDYGPALPNASHGPKPSIGPQLPPTEAAPQRDEWMLLPPTSSGYSERDPTRMRNRKFASKASSGASADVSSIWTETPEEKLKRLQDAVLGREDKAKGAAPAASKRDHEEEERQRKIAANIEARRGRSLYDEHQSRRQASGKKPDEEEDDPSKRGFDREKDMALGGKIGSSQRRELMNKAANFGGKFQKGSYL